MRRLRRFPVVVVVVALVLAACGGEDNAQPEGGKKPSKIVLVTHESFAVSKDVLASFERRSGLKVEILRSGDAGSTLSQAILTKDHPLGDVLFGVDNTFLTRALDEDLFVPYEARGLDRVRGDLALDPQHRVTPVDYGDVCLNYDKGWFGEEGLPPPDSLDDLVDPQYKGLTVVENPATSSPGLAFLLASIAQYGEDGWKEWWKGLRANDVLVTPGWDQAYFESFTVGGGGDRPIVVSYASSPPADVVFADPPKDEPAIGVVEASCFRQVEFAGILRGTKREAAARDLVDFLISKEFQEDVPLQMYVFPATRDAALPEVFRKFAVVPAHPLTLDADQIGAGRDRWIEEWTDLVLR